MRNILSVVILLICINQVGMSADPVVLTENNDVVVSAVFPIPDISSGNIFPQSYSNGGLQVQYITLPGCRSAGHPGEPVLPVYPVLVALPQDRSLDGVDVVETEFQQIEGSYLPAPGQVEVPLSFEGPFIDLAPDPLIYSKGELYPAGIVEDVQVNYCRGTKMVGFNLRPVRYLPESGTLFTCSEIKIRITTQPERVKNPEVVRFRDLPVDRDWIQRKVMNPELINDYSVDEMTTGTVLSESRENFPYVIVTQDFLQTAFQPLLNHKQSMGYPGTIVTMAWVESNYAGVDWAEKLRNFIIDAYNNWNTEYVLLGGDDDRSDVGGESGDYIVPRRDFWVTSDYGETESAMPCDMYYACLDGNLNNDGDARWGETTDGIGGGDIDWFGEVHIGRAAVDSVQETANFVDAVIAYENTDPEASHMKQALMVGELLWDDPTYGGDYKDEIRFGASTHGYTTAGFPSDWTVSTLYDRDVSGSWGTSQLYQYLNSNNLHVVNHLGHSDVGYCMRLYNNNVDNNLNNTTGYFAYSQGCYDGSFDNRGAYGSTENYDCILEHFTTQPQGSFAFIGNARYGWGEYSSTNGSSQYYDRQFFDAIFGEEILELGAANQDSKEDNIGFLSYGANRWVAYELNLFGCPQTRLGGGLSRVGAININRLVYGDGVDMEITVRDVDLNMSPGIADSVQITVVSGTGDQETVTLMETGAATSTFAGSIMVVQGASSPENGQLEVFNGFLVTARYIDADDGMGGTNIVREVSASTDFISPSIANISVLSTTDTEAVISFTTSEQCLGMIRYGSGTPVEVAAGSATGLIHTVTVENLEGCTAYYFQVEVEDLAGNMAMDDAGGDYYEFTTWERYLMLQESMDTNPGWNGEGQWAWGQPTGSGGDHGNSDPVSGYTGTAVYGYNLNGGYPDNLARKYLTTAAIDCSEGAGSVLGFWCWLGVESNTYDHAVVQISNNGSNWTQLWENPAETLDGGEWQWFEFDVSDVADGHSTVYVRWGMGDTDGGWTYCGWNIDDVEISSSRPCGPVNTPTPTPTFTPQLPTATPVPTGTNHPTYTPVPTNTPIPTFTPLPTSTPNPPTNTPPVTYTPAPTHTPPPSTFTPAPTLTPPPTATPEEPSATPTQTGQETVTPSPVETATPAATSTPPEEIKIDLRLNQQVFEGGDTFRLTCQCYNPGPAVLMAQYIILDVFQHYYFWPNWSESMNYQLSALEKGMSDEVEVLAFQWPEGDMGSVDGLYFWGALLVPDSNQIAGEYDVIEFGYK